MLSLQQVSYAIPQRQLLENVNFQLSDGQHLGLVGRNGSGKSTLFKLIQEQLSPDQGRIELAKHWKILAVKQEMPDGDLSPLAYLLSQDTERLELLHELETCTDSNRMGDLYERLIAIDAYTAEARAAVVLKGLGFSDEAQQQPLHTFSGGFRMRAALGAVLFQEPDLLLLDEPTNHLDLETSTWLETFLKRYPKSFLLISHERDFLNATVNGILHLKQGKIERYAGNFDTFLKTYEMQQANIAAFNKKMNAQREHMVDFVNRFRAKASKAKQAQSRMKALEKMHPIPVEKNDPTIAFDFPEVDALAPPLISFEKIFLGYGDKTVLKNLTASIGPQDRIALLGSNGNGKTTFARFLAGELEAQKGSCTLHPKLNIAFYRQDQFETLELQQRAYDHVYDRLPTANDTQIRAHLGRFGFPKEKAEQKVRDLSGGERARLLFACLTADRPTLLILDEPTNHLDIEMRESLIATLNRYKGAVVLVTHDRYLLQHVADSLWIVKNGSIQSFEGDLGMYERLMEEN
ncbi:MAG: ABC-F family ATP-binding cassette domain-containing protein [Alphaproteobacteria bacterium]